MLISILTTLLRWDTWDFKCSHPVYASGRGEKMWRCAALFIKIPKCASKTRGESSLLFWLGFCKQQKMVLSTELNDKVVVISSKKSRGRWFHTNSLGIISIFLLCQSQHICLILRLASWWEDGCSSSRSSYSHGNTRRWRKKLAFKTEETFPK